MILSNFEVTSACIMINYNTISLIEATKMQNEMRKKVRLTALRSSIKTIAGADISHNKNSDIIYAGIVVLSYPEMEVLSYSLIEAKTSFPYVPQYLGFREVPALIEAWEQLPEKPDICILDGQGIAHPRRMGIASHFGVLTNSATIGCAKNILYGTYKPLGLEKFSSSFICDGEEKIGFSLRTKNDVKPVYISPGNNISINESLEVIKNCVRKHRIPEPTRLAHEKVNLFRVGKLKTGYFKTDIQTSLF